MRLLAHKLRCCSNFSLIRSLVVFSDSWSPVHLNEFTILSFTRDIALRSLKSCCAKEDMSVVSSLGFIGAGQVAKVIANGFLSARIIKANQIIVSATSNTDLDHFRNIGCNATDNNKLVMKESKFVFLEIRANVFPGVLKEISSIVTRNHLLASLASGVTLSFLENSLPDKTRIVRVMLNSAVQYREGIIAVTRGRFARAKDITLVHEMMSPVGYCVDVNENSMAMVTALINDSRLHVRGYRCISRRCRARWIKSTRSSKISGANGCWSRQNGFTQRKTYQRA